MSSNVAATPPALRQCTSFGTQTHVLRQGFCGSRAPKTFPVCRSQQDDHARLNRRDLVLGSTAGLPFLLSNHDPAWGAPIIPPDLSNCKVSTPANEAELNCCLKTSKEIRDFVLPQKPPIGIRPAAHLVDDAYTQRYIKAYELLKALPDDDNRKFINQAYMHCIMCDHVLVQPGTDQAFDIHYSWLFFPWHRWYLYFHERILQKLLNDPTFRLPFWNWDNQSATEPLPNSMPALFTKNSVLVDEYRNTDHAPPAICNLSWAPGKAEGQDDLATLRADNNATLYQEIVSAAKTATLFLGGAYRYGDAASNYNGSATVAGSVENGVHGHVHAWCGAKKPTKNNLEDMGALYSAAKDPLFYAHHANIDRMWVIWKSLGRSDYTDPDWLNASFLFFDENGDPVKVYIRDALATEAMGYQYQQMPLDWLNAKATESGASSSTTSKLKARPIPEFGNKSAGKSQNLKEDPFSSSIKLPQKKTTVSGINNSIQTAMAADAVAESDGNETVLLIQDVEVAMNQFVSFDVYINLPDADINTRKNIKEFAGSFVYLPHMSSAGSDSSNMKQTLNVRLGIGETLEDLGIKSGDNFVVTLVPSNGDATIVVKGFDIEFE